MYIGQIAQHAEDLDRAAEFYTKLLGPPVGRFDPPGLLFFKLGDTRLLLERGASSALIYLHVDDVHVTVEKLRADGVTIESEPHRIFQHTDDSLGPAGKDEWMAFFRDTEDNVVGLISYDEPAGP